MEICEICGKQFDKSKRSRQNKHNICSQECKNIFLGNINRKHNLAYKTKLYSVWKALRQRCNNPNDKRYKNYGGRGISICKEWESFENFYNWAIENGYSNEPLASGRNKLSIDRIDNNGNYEPNNCRWADDYIQANNKTKSMPKEIKYKQCPICKKQFKSKQKSIITCSRECGIAHRILIKKEKTKDMYKKQCPICHKIFEDRSGHLKDRVYCSVKCKNMSLSPIWEFNGKKMRVLEWAEELGISAHCLHHRKEMGWSVEEILTIPKGCRRSKSKE